MTSFYEIPITIEPEQMVEDCFADMAERFPGWEPAEGNPETFLIRALVYRLFVPLAELAADVPAEVFHRFGEEIVALAPDEAQAATVETTWTMIDDSGYTIPEGTQVDIAATGSEAVGFRVVEEVLVPNGSTATSAGEVLLEAIEPGAAGNDLPGPATLVDALAYVDSIALVGTPAGGADAEDPDVYLSRLAATMQTLSTTPIIARDVEILARNVSGVTRAVALDNFDPGVDDPDDPGTWDSEKTTTVVVHGPDGAACSAPVKAEVESELAARREENFAFHVEDPDYATINVNFAVTPLSGFEQGTVDADVIAALTEALSPGAWGALPPDEETAWVNRPTIYYQDLSTLVNNVEGVDIHTTLEFEIDGVGFASVDVEMPGAAPLPEPGTIEAV